MAIKHRISMAEFDSMDAKQRDWYILQALYEGDEKFTLLTSEMEAMKLKVDEIHANGGGGLDDCLEELDARWDERKEYGDGVIKKYSEMIETHILDRDLHTTRYEKMTWQEHVKEKGSLTGLAAGVSSLIYVLADYLQHLGG